MLQSKVKIAFRFLERALGKNRVKLVELNPRTELPDKRRGVMRTKRIAKSPVVVPPPDEHLRICLERMLLPLVAVRVYVREVIRHSVKPPLLGLHAAPRRIHTFYHTILPAPQRSASYSIGV